MRLKTCRKEKSKRKVSRKKFKVLAIGLAGLIVLSGFNINKEEVKTSVPDSTVTTSSYQSTVNIPDEYVESSLEGTPVTLTETEYIELMDYISNMQTEYPDSQLYGYEEAMAEYPVIEEVTEHSQSILDDNGDFTADKLFEIVKKNNSDYLQTVSSTKKSFVDELPDETIRKVCQLAIDTINYQLTENPDLDKNEISCKFGDLKIFGKTMSSVAMVDEDNCLVISENMVGLSQLMNEKQDAKTGTIVHELNHVIQSQCVDKEKENYYINGVCWGNNFDQFNNETSPNPFRWSWFIEASAEQNMTNQLGYEVMVYKSPVSYLNSLKLASTLNPNVRMNQLESACFSNDPTAFYSAFNRENYDREIVNLMYAIEITQGYNNFSIDDVSPRGFFQKYKELYGEELSDDTGNLPAYKFALKVPICETLSKVFYENLAKSVLNGNATKEDVYYLIKVFEADLIGHLAVDENKRESIYDYQKEFYASYTALQEQFFSALAISNGVTLEDVKDDFDSYSIRIKSGTETKDHNCDLAFLNDSSKDYVISRETKLYSSARPGISEYYYNHQNNGLSLS